MASLQQFLLRLSSILSKSMFVGLILGIQLLLPKTARAEGSVDFINYPGYRLFLEVEKRPQMKVYAKEGEYINVGASHLGIGYLGLAMGGKIRVIRPDGTVHITYTYNSSTKVATIENDIQEKNGPTGGGTTNGAGYKPGVVRVDAGQSGIWTVLFEFDSYNTAFPPSQNLLNNAPWKQSDILSSNKRVILAWDITISQNAAGNEGGTFVKGRVFTNEFLSMVGEKDSLTVNPTSPKYYILNKEGFLYKIDFKETKPWSFPVISSSRGLVYSNLEPCYCSAFDTLYIRSSDPTSWAPGQLYYYEPQAQDYKGVINNKIFINPPNADMPNEALVTDFYRQNTHVTWLYNTPEIGTPTVTIADYAFSSGNPAYICKGDTTTVGVGGYLRFTTSSGGNAIMRIDVNSNGSFSDTIDRAIFTTITAGTDSIYWDGKDGYGNVVPATLNFQFRFGIDLRAGEIHMMMYDVENNPREIEFTRLNGINSPDNSVYFDFSNIDGPVSGGGTKGNALPTDTTYTYNDVWGNRKMTDYFSFLEFKNLASGNILLQIVDTCAKACSITLVKPSISTNSPVCSNDTIRLSVQSPYPGLIDTISGSKYFWVNGNGDTLSFNTPSVKIPVGSPLAVQPFKVQAWLSVDCYSEFSNPVFVQINQAPTAVAVNSGPICSGNSVDLTATNVSGGEYSWKNLTSGQTVGTDRVITVPNITQNTVFELSVNVPGCAQTAKTTTTVNVVTEPVAVAGDGGNNSFCGAGNATLTAQANVNGTYEWRVVGNPTIVSTQQNPVIPITKTTSFEVTVAIVGCPNVAKDTITITVKDIPLAIAANLNNDKLCAAGNVSLIANDVPGATYEWRIQGNPAIVSTSQNPVIPITQTTTFELTITLNGCKSAVASTKISVENAPELEQVQGQGKFCEGESTSIIAIFKQTVNGEYSWTFPDGTSTPFIPINATSCTLVINKLLPQNSGVYKLTIKSIDNCTFTYNTAATLEVTPKPIAIATNGGKICAGNAGLLFANTVSGATYEWNIKGQSAIISTAQNPTIPNMTATTTFQLVVKVGTCISQVAETTIEVAQNPIATNLKGGGTYCEGDTLKLSADLDLPGYTGLVNYTWTGPNFSFSGSANAPGPFTVTIPTLNKVQEGAYTVVLALAGNPTCSSAPQSVVVNVEAKPAAPVVTSNSPVCFGDTIFLSTQYPNADGIIWLNSKGDTIGINKLIVGIASNSTKAVGPYKAKVSVKGCMSDLSTAANVTVVQLPSIAASNDGPICENDTVTLSATPVVASYIYEWRQIGSSNIISTSPSFKVPKLTTTTTFEVTVRIPNCSQVVKAQTTVIVNKGPVVNSNLTGSGAYCIGENVTLSGTGVPGAGTVTYVWIYVPTQTPVFIGVAPKGGPFPFPINNIQPNQAGAYLLVVQDQVTGCTTIGGTCQVDVKPKPQLPVITAVDDTICVGGTLDLSCTNFPAPVTYQWFRNDTLIGTTTTNTFQVQNMTIDKRGFYSVKVTVNGCGSDVSAPIFIEVFGPGMPFTLANPTASKPACLNSNLKLEVMNMAGATYMWFGPDGKMIAGATGSTLNISNIGTSNAGAYYVKVTKNECSTVVSDTIIIRVADAPIANPDSYSTLVDVPITGATILSNDNKGNNAEVIVTIVTTPKNGTAEIVNNTLKYTPNSKYIGLDELIYKICSKDCPDQCDTAKVSITVNGPDDCDPIPNVITPDDDGLNDVFFIPCLGLDKYPNNELVIYNRWGDKVFEAKPYKNDWKGTYDTKPLPAGTYFFILKPEPNQDKVYKGYLSIIR